MIDYSSGIRKAYEIKSNHTFSFDFFKGLEKWSVLSGSPTADNYVIYNGKEDFRTSKGNLVPWEKFGEKF